MGSARELRIRLNDLFNRFKAWRGGYGVGSGCRVHRTAFVRVSKDGEIRIGDHCDIRPYAMLITGGGRIRLGHHVSINPFTVLNGQGGIDIGDNVRIAAHCNLVSFNHGFDDPAVPVRKQEHSRKGLTIEDDVWIGANATVLDGVTVARGCVIGAGSVVTRSTEPFGVYAGVPARRIGTRGEQREPGG